MLPWALAGGLALAAPALADDRRVVVGESVAVGADEVLDSVICLFCSVHVEGVVRKTAFVVLGELENHGTIEGDAAVVLGTMRLHGSVGGDAFALMGNIEGGPADVVIGGDAVVVLGDQAGLSPGNVGGEFKQIGDEGFGQKVIAGVLVGLFVVALAGLVGLMALNLVAYLMLGPKRVETIASTLSQSTLTCFLGGICTCFSLTVVGLVVALILPVSLPMILVFFVVSVAGYCGLTYWIGTNLFSSRAKLTATVAASTLVIMLQMIPVIGWMVALALWNIAIGAAVLSGFGTSTDWLSARMSSTAPGRSVP